MKLGIDIGGVVIDRANDDTDTSFFTDNFLRSQPTAGCFEAVKLLADRFGHANVYLVSKCGVKIQNKTKLWLDHWDFWQQTGLFKTNLHFCLTRDGKAPICRGLGITHFVDDRLEVLSYLKTVEHKFLFQPSTREINKFQDYLTQVTVVQDWASVVSAIGLRKTGVLE